MSVRSVLLSFSTFACCARAGTMDCGEGVGLCGTLVLESGYGTGNYNHPEPVVHGLWPEVGNYGTSECLAPASTAQPTVVYSCYEQKGTTEADCLSFEQHEWSAHGVCAGATDAEDFFTQLCALAVAPLEVMNTSRQDGGDLEAMATALESAGYAIFDVDTSSNSQVELYACAGPDTRWVLAPLADFPTVCGGWTNTTTDDGGSNSNDDTPADTCVPDKHGPPCSSDSDCADVSGCVRCASSGYCTDVPLS